MSGRNVVINAIAIHFVFFSLTQDVCAKSLTIGRVSTDPRRTYKELKPMVDYVASQLGNYGIDEGAVIVAKNHDEMLRYLREGRVDWVQKGVFEALIYMREVGADIVLRSWRQGVPNYHSVIFARKDGAVGSLKDLVGKKIAFEDAGSTSAFFVPAAILRRAKYQLVELASPREQPPPDKIGYVFAGDELSITTWVHRRLVDGGAYHNQNWSNSEETPEAMRKDLKIIYRGKPMPRMLELFRGTLDSDLKAKMKQILLHAHEDPAAAGALEAYGPSTAKFDEFIGHAKKELEEAMDLIRYFGSSH